MALIPLRTLTAATLALAGLAVAATDASASRNRYTDEPNPGFFGLLYGDDGDDDPGYVYERPIRRPPHAYRGPGRFYDHGRPPPPPPFVEDGY